MEINTAIINRHALLLFNFWASKKQNDKRIGDLTVGDFFEMIAFLNTMENENGNN
jgi:hypothetical protein